MFGGLFQDVLKPLREQLSPSSGKLDGDDPKLEASLQLMIGGFWLRVANHGGSVARDVHAEVVSWANGAPEASILINKDLPAMPRGYDTRFPVNLTDHGGSIDTTNGPIRSSSSGYIVLTCSNSKEPKFWAFFLPREDSWGKALQYTGLEHPWPLAEFNYASEKPKLGTTVNFPWVVDEEGWFPPRRLTEPRE